MTVPDQRHINQVREALWHRPGAGASVMIGSGFSRNARRVRPGSKPLPMLDEIARDLSATLYPDDGADEKIPQERILRLAQAYEAEFRPTGITRSPEENGGGRRLHARECPRATPSTCRGPMCSPPTGTHCWNVQARPSGIVPTLSSEARTTSLGGLRPRIVKLHGSLPNPRLVLTEEDYRTYPTAFSPFVNTVQQAMMETIFVLIGFSGNDPNFLHWSGWVRDNLDEAALKIYLAGFLNLSRPERQMLRDRNVVAIDLAQHPRARQVARASSTPLCYAVDSLHA